MHSYICGSCGSDWSMRYADTHKGASVSAERIYRLMLSQTLQRISRGRLHIGMHFRPLYMWLALAIIVVNCIVKNMLILFCGIHLLK